MATMNVSLPDQMKDWVETQVRDGKYGNSSDYVRDLIRHDQERAAALAEFDRLIEEGFASGISDLTAEEIFEEARQSYLAGEADSDAA
ncbi:MAG: type toxin-antitoxin system ParD family antitoxin [Devosia sp.]|uniref:type II toxin-antitoxin system ParD family antitoxin n=1 Tax=Devosia sp. TaxID=1871048 RepID=UPI00261B15C8|nr:type II toxin-antitoxin system ParD family antitoxin [Devosia sp.]MDB5586005.1 type toxin-antitoxin system ParD family antitoxin [Devosia sp.]